MSFKVLGLSLALVMTAGAGRAETVTLGFGSLPTAQGWNYISNGGPPLPETSYYTATGTELLQNTLGFPADAVDGYYARPAPFSGSTDFSMTVRARVSAASEGFPLGFIFGVDSLYFGLDTTNFGSFSNGEGLGLYEFPTGFSPVGDVLYRLRRTGNNVRLTGDSFVLFDGVLTGATPTDNIIFGDGTKFGNATGAYSQLVFSTAGVPEPATWAMLVMGFGLAGAGVRRRRAALS